MQHRLDWQSEPENAVVRKLFIEVVLFTANAVSLCQKYCCLSLETSLESGFHRGSRICLERIREALLHHRWQEAAECMISYPQIIEESSHDPPANHQQYKQVGVCFVMKEPYFQTFKKQKACCKNWVN